MSFDSTFTLPGVIGVLDGFDGSRVIDAVLTVGERSWILSAGWWLATDFVPGDEVVGFAAAPKPCPEWNGWEVTIPGQRLILMPPESAEARAACESMRMATDMNPGSYDQQLAEVVRRFDIPEEAVAPWRAALATRPYLTPEGVLSMSDNLPRTVAILHLLDADGKLVDAVAADDQGNAASAAGTVWGAAAASDYRVDGLTGGQSDPTAWAAYFDGRGVYTGGGWRKAQVGTMAGPVGQLAAASIGATLTA